MIDFDDFLNWATDRFGSANIKIKGDEILTHSIFTEDAKYHLWMNPSGGKSKHPEFGAFRCWKTDQRGSLVKLVSIVDQIPFEEAEELISSATTLRQLEQKVDEFFGITIEELPVTAKNQLELPPDSILITDLPSYNFYRKKAYFYLKERNLSIDGLYVCTNGDYKNRIIIPYYDKNGSLVYYNARLISNSKKAKRYMKPKEKDLKQEDILYFKTFPKINSKVYLVEGEFDAMSLNAIGLFGAACGGKNLSESQIEIMRSFIPVLALDNDEEGKDWGLQALLDIGDKLLISGFKEVYFVRPPKGFKDWNALLQKHSVETIQQYIKKFESPYNEWTRNQLVMKTL
jgi:hypothetical protein